MSNINVTFYSQTLPPAVDLLTDVADLLLLQGGLGLLWQLLVLLLHHLEPPPLSVQVADAAAALAKLIQQVLDLIRQILVLSADSLKILNTLIPCSLYKISLKS